MESNENPCYFQCKKFGVFGDDPFYYPLSGKWDGLPTKVNNPTAAVCLVEFLGGINFNTTSTKEKSDAIKLCKYMKDMITSLHTSPRLQENVLR